MPPEIILQRALIRALHGILAACKGMLRAWEQYVDAREKEVTR